MQPIVTGLLIGGAIGIAMTAVELFFWSSLFVNCRPWEILVVSGRRYYQNGKRSSFRIARNRGVLKIPVIEQVSSLDASMLHTTIKVEHAYALNNERVTLSMFVLFCVAMDEKHLVNAVERYLGLPGEQIVMAGQETLQGHLRGVLVKTDIKPLDTIKLIQELHESSRSDMKKIGLQILHTSLVSMKVEG